MIVCKIELLTEHLCVSERKPLNNRNTLLTVSILKMNFTKIENGQFRWSSQEAVDDIVNKFGYMLKWIEEKRLGQNMTKVNNLAQHNTCKK